MTDQTPKVQLIGDSGKMRVTSEKLPMDNRTQHFKHLTEEGAKLFETEGFTYKGSAVLHIYERDEEFGVVKVNYATLNLLEGVKEGSAIEGFNLLQKRMMAQYGKNVRPGVGQLPEEWV